MYTCVCIYLWGRSIEGAPACVNAFMWRPRITLRHHSSDTVHLLFWDSLSYLELASLPRLVGHWVPGIPLSLLLSAEAARAMPSYLDFFMRVLGIKFRSSCLPSSRSLICVHLRQTFIVNLWLSWNSLPKSGWPWTHDNFPATGITGMCHYTLACCLVSCQLDTACRVFS